MYMLLKDAMRRRNYFSLYEAPGKSDGKLQIFLN